LDNKKNINHWQGVKRIMGTKRLAAIALFHGGNDPGKSALYLSSIAGMIQIYTKCCSTMEKYPATESKKTPPPPGCKYGEGSTLFT
jgi:hypothetical protein